MNAILKPQPQGSRGAHWTGRKEIGGHSVSQGQGGYRGMAASRSGRRAGTGGHLEVNTRTITDHTVSGDQAVQLDIAVLDEPGQGGACHDYAILWDGPVQDGPKGECRVRFQNGPIKEFGVNGITQEALLAIVIDRLRCFQAGPFACEENATALELTKMALNTLQERTRARIRRGIEGTNQK
jgi:hypothetical protein